MEGEIKIQENLINHLRILVNSLEKDKSKLVEKIEELDNKSIAEVVKAPEKKVLELDKLLKTKKSVIRSLRENIDEYIDETIKLKKENKDKDLAIFKAQVKLELSNSTLRWVREL